MRIFDIYSRYPLAKGVLPNCASFNRQKFSHSKLNHSESSILVARVRVRGGELDTPIRASGLRRPIVRTAKSSKYSTAGIFFNSRID